MNVAQAPSGQLVKFDRKLAGTQWWSHNNFRLPPGTPYLVFGKLVKTAEKTMPKYVMFRLQFHTLRC